MPESPLLIIGGSSPGRFWSVKRRDAMVAPLNPKSRSSGSTRRTALGLILGAPLLGACAGVQQSLSSFSNPSGSQPGPSGPPQQPLVSGTRHRTAGVSPQ